MAGRKPGTPAIDRFYEKVAPPNENGCRLWTAGKTNKDPAKAYGAFQESKGEFQTAHSWIFEHVNGPMPDGMECCHKCDVRLCVELTHLFAGTRKQNMEDAARKGRMDRLKKAKGEDHGCAVFTWEIVDSIRARFERGESQSQMAREYGVTVNAVHCIVRFKSWDPAHRPKENAS